MHAVYCCSLPFVLTSMCALRASQGYAHRNCHYCYYYYYCFMLEENWDGNEAERTWSTKIRQEFLAVGEARKAILWPTPGLMREQFIVLDSQRRGTQCLHLSSPLRPGTVYWDHLPTNSLDCRVAAEKKLCHSYCFLLFDTHNYDKTEAGISLALFCSFKSVVKVAICNWINDCAHIAPGVEIRVGRQGRGYSGLRLFLSIVA